jgi:energy-coupling factor transporter ATP-binding protein EcfA2
MFRFKKGDKVLYKTPKANPREVVLMEDGKRTASGNIWYKIRSERGGIGFVNNTHLFPLGTTFEEGKPLPTVPKPALLIEEKTMSTGPVFSVSIDKVASNFMEQTLKQLLDAHAGNYVAELQRALQPTIIKIDDKEILIDKSKHYMFKNVLYKCMVHKQVFLSGPTGSGKTTLAAQIADAMNVPFYFLSCSAGMSEAHLLGRMLFDGTYASSDLVKAYEEGGVFLFDEIDAADNNTLLVINSALANNRLSVPNRKDKPHAERHANFVCIVAGNTWGEGSIQYQGRTALDRAFLDRFAMSKAEINYDGDLEKLITSKKPIVSKVFHEFRAFISANKIDKPISTRTIISAYKDHENGRTMSQILGEFVIGWSADEVKRSEIFLKKW